MEFRVYSDCPECSKFLQDHPSLDVKGVRRVRWNNGKYRHTSQKGRMLHKYVMKRTTGKEG